MKRIIGVKKTPSVPQTGVTPEVHSKVAKSKKKISPGPEIAEKKVPKMSRWTFSSAHASQPVGLSVKREIPRDATSKDRPAFFNSTAIARTDRLKRSPKRMTQPPLWDQGRPLWGVKQDYSQPARKDRSTSRTHRLARTNSSLNTSFSRAAERPNKLDHSIEIRKVVNGGNLKSGPPATAELSTSVQANAQVLPTEQPQDGAGSTDQTEQVDRGQPHSNLKSALKKFPKTLHSGVLANTEPAIEERSFSDEGVVDHLFPVMTASVEVSPCRSKRGQDDSELLHQGEDPIQEFLASAHREQRGESVPALVTDPDDVETLRKLSNFNKENPNSSYFIEFNERELKGREIEKFGGIKKVMTPQIRSKRLSKRKSSMADDGEPEQQSNKERRSSSSSGGSVHRRQEMHGLSS